MADDAVIRALSPSVKCGPSSGSKLFRLPATLRFILSHPLNRDRRLAALAGFLGWQVASRLRSEIEFRWINGATLRLSRGMTGATGNVYCGLHEFVEMAFVLHLLRAQDLFLDIGANIGSYTILASRLCRAQTIAFEPDPQAASRLERNIDANDIAALATVHRIALGQYDGEITLTAGLDTMNRVAMAGDERVQIVPVRRLDGICDGVKPTLMKLDVEGYEGEVLTGAAAVLASPSLLAVQSELRDENVDSLLGSFGFQPVFYDPFTRRIARRPFGYQIANMLYVRDLAAVQERIATAPRRQVAGKYL
jgi:FkbM family methyltransferase